MSRYGYFACLDCKVALWLGKATFSDDDLVYAFRRMPDDGPSDLRNWEQVALTRSLWKMLADHARHQLKVVVEGDVDELVVVEEYVEIGGHEEGDIDFEMYLKGWQG